MMSRVENYDEGLRPSDVYQRRDCDGSGTIHVRGDHPLKQLEGIGTKGGEQTRRHSALWSKMKAVYPPAQVAPYDSSFFGASPPATRWTKLATRAASGPAVTGRIYSEDSQSTNGEQRIQ